MKKRKFLGWMLLMLCLCLITPYGIINRDSIASAATTGEVTASSLYVRTGPGTNYDKVTVNGSYAFFKKGEKITITGEKNGWYKISFTFNGKKLEGYVLGDYVKTSGTKTTGTSGNSSFTAKSTTSSNLNLAGTVTATNLNVRQKASTASKKLASLPKSHKVTVLSESMVNSKKWYRISYKLNGKTKTGYVLSDYVKLTLSKTKSIKATVNSKTKVNIKTGPGDSYKNLTNKKGKAITLSNKTEITLTKEVTDSKGKKWFLASFTVSKVNMSGYIPGNKVLFQKTSAKTSENTTVTPTPTPTVTPTPTPTPTSAVTPAPTPTPTTTDQPSTVLSDEEFESWMTGQGFPESYKPYLRELHSLHPTWVFEAFHTGLNWNTVITKESALGVNLISNGKSIEWKSLEPGAYNWSTDTFIPFDGSTWVTPSKEALEYYMDPRNFLTEKSIFQFELLTFKSEYQNITGVEGILYNTPLYNKTYTYLDDIGNNVEITYSQTFMDAAQYSGVSPYHLASRVKQEVVTGTTTLSSSVSGTVPGYEGLYNFYNIGATNSTASGGAVINGLKYAKNGTSNKTLNQLYRIPWDNPYDAIVGGAYIIGSTYINRGQNTVYLQKFNVTSTSTFSHQYMSNIEAPNAEAKKTYAAYSVMAETPIVFSIPVYENMPEEPAPLPAPKLNPNNWLKTLKVEGYSLTPTFDLTKDQVYSLIVDGSVTKINVTATPVSKKATVSGTGTIPLQEGINDVVITVTAENGDIREYLIQVVRESQ